MGQRISREEAIAGYSRCRQVKLNYEAGLSLLTKKQYNKLYQRAERFYYILCPGGYMNWQEIPTPRSPLSRLYDHLNQSEKSTREMWQRSGATV